MSMDPAVLAYLRNPPASQIAHLQLEVACQRAASEGKKIMLHFGDRCWGWYVSRQSTRRRARMRRGGGEPCS